MASSSWQPRRNHRPCASEKGRKPGPRSTQAGGARTPAAAWLRLPPAVEAPECDRLDSWFILVSAMCRLALPLAIKAMTSSAAQRSRAPCCLHAHAGQNCRAKGKFTWQSFCIQGCVARWL